MIGRWGAMAQEMYMIRTKVFELRTGEAAGQGSEVFLALAHYIYSITIFLMPNIKWFFNTIFQKTEIFSLIFFFFFQSAIDS